jgi:hypothetical protein
MQLNSPLTIVGRCLAPALGGPERAALAGVLQSGAVPWEQCLALANQHECTTLWYVRLRQHGLLALLPEDLQEYLAQLHQANRQRNARLKAELVTVLGILKRRKIPVLALKGAAVFVDDLYTDDGARMMRDLDLLIPQARIEVARELLKIEGYEDDPEDSRHEEPAPLNARHHHLPPLRHPARGIQIELHYKAAYAHAGRVLDVASVWPSARPGRLKGLAVHVLNPTHALLLNMLHATQPYGEFIRAALKLADLAECAAIVDRFGKDIQYGKIWPELREHKLLLELATYALLAHKLTRARIKYPRKLLATLHEYRLAVLNDLTIEDKTLQTTLWQILAQAYYFIKMPGWVYRNACYGDDQTPKWMRLRFILQRLLDPTSREKALNAGPD